LRAAGEELLADLARPGERRQYAHRFGDVVEDLRRLAVAIGAEDGGHRRTVAGTSGSMVDRAASPARSGVDD
jgi:hypothetical protein